MECGTPRKINEMHLNGKRYFFVGIYRKDGRFIVLELYELNEENLKR